MAWNDTLAFWLAIITSVRSTPLWPTSKALAIAVEACWVSFTLSTAWESISEKLGAPASAGA